MPAKEIYEWVQNGIRKEWLAKRATETTANE